MSDAPTADGGPGFLAFLAFFLLALALWFLMRNMNARMRRMSYRQQAAHRGKDDPQVAPGEVELDESDPGPTATLDPPPEATGRRPDEDRSDAGQGGADAGPGGAGVDVDVDRTDDGPSAPGR